MTNKKAQKPNRKKASQSLYFKLKESLKSYFPILKFVGGFILLISLFYSFWFSTYFTEQINPRIAHINAFFAGKLLNLLGQATTSSGANIYSQSFSISISKGCDGIEAMAIFASSLLAFPIALKNKIPGLFLGIFILTLLNLIRIISLYFIGKFFPNSFEMFHAEIWPALFILVALSLWGSLIYRSIKK